VKPLIYYLRQIPRAAWLGLTDPFLQAYRHRYLILLLLKRDVISRTSGTLLGMGWLLLQPAMQLIGFWFLLDIVLKIRAPGQISFVNYFLLGMLAWLFISEVLSRSLNILQEFSGIYRRALFPLTILPLVPLLLSTLMYTLVSVIAAGVLQGAAAMPMALVLYLALALWLLPFCYVLAVGGLFLKDLGQIFPFFITLLLYLTPILYMPTMLPEAMRDFMLFNPFADWMALLHGHLQGMAWTEGNLWRPLLWWALLLGPAWVLYRRAEPHVREMV